MEGIVGRSVIVLTRGQLQPAIVRASSQPLSLTSDFTKTEVSSATCGSVVSVLPGHYHVEEVEHQKSSHLIFSLPLRPVSTFLSTPFTLCTITAHPRINFPPSHYHHYFPPSLSHITTHHSPPQVLLEWEGEGEGKGKREWLNLSDSSKSQAVFVESKLLWAKRLVTMEQQRRAVAWPSKVPFVACSLVSLSPPPPSNGRPSIVDGGVATPLPAILTCRLPALSRLPLSFNPISLTVSACYTQPHYSN